MFDRDPEKNDTCCCDDVVDVSLGEKRRLECLRLATELAPHVVDNEDVVSMAGRMLDFLTDDNDNDLEHEVIAAATIEAGSKYFDSLAMCAAGSDGFNFLATGIVTALQRLFARKRGEA